MTAFTEAQAKALIGKRVQWKGSQNPATGRVAKQVKLGDDAYDVIVRWPKAMLEPSGDAPIEQFDKAKFNKHLRVVE